MNSLSTCLICWSIINEPLKKSTCQHLRKAFIRVSICTKPSNHTKKTINWILTLVQIIGSQDQDSVFCKKDYEKGEVPSPTPLDQFDKQSAHDPKRKIWTYKSWYVHPFRDWPSLVRMVLTMNTWLPSEEELTVEEVWISSTMYFLYMVMDTLSLG